MAQQKEKVETKDEGSSETQTILSTIPVATEREVVIVQVSFRN